MMNIKLPRFARDYVRDHARCASCSKSLREMDVTFVGAGRDKDDSICFSYEIVCQHCNKTNTFIDSTRKFTDSNWWEELSQWHKQALVEMGSFEPRPESRGEIVLLVGPAPLQRLTVSYGYKGDIGPVILQGYGFLFWNGHGAVRLERNNQIRPLVMGTDGSLPSKALFSFPKKTPEGTRFFHAGREWTRLTRAELQEIVRDRVFTVIDPAEEKKAMSKSTKQVRGRYEIAHAQKSGGKARRASRNAGTVDS